jgi:hypothetical protein
MREALAAINGTRSRFTATFKRFGSRTAYRGPAIRTALFVDVCGLHGEALTDHLWMNVGERIAALDLAPGDRVSFEARVTEYVKGYKGRRELDEAKPLQQDYRLSFPTCVKRLAEQAAVGSRPSAEEPEASSQALTASLFETDITAPTATVVGSPPFPIQDDNA